MQKLSKFLDGAKMQSEKETSQITSQLNSRIQTNKKFGSVDLDEWLFEKLKIKKSCNVLDVGCGTGNHIIKLAELFHTCNYYGIDISNTSINEAKEKARQKNLKITFICGDASVASYMEDGFYDLIMSIYALYYAKGTQKVLTILKTKLKKSGRIAVMSPYKGNNEEWYGFLSSFMKMPEEIESVAKNFMDKEVLPFAKANFNKVQTFYFENRITIPSCNDLKKYWLSNIYHNNEYNAEFEKKAAELYLKNNCFTITKRALLVIMG